MKSCKKSILANCTRMKCKEQPMSEQALLQIEGIHTFIGQFHILEGVTVSVPRGSIHVMLGRNGAGKTTTLKSIMGITPPTEGKIIYDGNNISGKRPYEIAQMG